MQIVSMVLSLLCGVALFLFGMSLMGTDSSAWLETSWRPFYTG